MGEESEVTERAKVAKSLKKVLKHNKHTAEAIIEEDQTEAS